jgi:hypothetical protein
MTTEAKIEYTLSLVIILFMVGHTMYSRWRR